MNLHDRIKSLAEIDIFKDAKDPKTAVGRPFYLDYDKAGLLVTDAWKERVGGIPQGTFLLAFYENDRDSVEECLLLRALQPTRLPTDSDVVASMIEYYKDNLKTSGSGNQLDDVTRYEYSFSGLECRILGTFFRGTDGNVIFGADVENFYSAHNYSVYKPEGKVLGYIVNYKDGETVAGSGSDMRIGKVRYSSSRRFQEKQEDVPVYVSPEDFIGKRTAAFGMTRTGKSNTVKKIIEATAKMSQKAEVLQENSQELAQFKGGSPTYRVGQIIFDINGEYANKNLQDEGTAIFDMFEGITERYSVLEKDGFKVLKTNFYEDILSGFELLKSIVDDSSAYMSSFFSADLVEPDINDKSAHTRWERRIAAYKCCLHKAGYSVRPGYTVKFPGNKDINDKANAGDPSKGISLDKACQWFEWVRDNLEEHTYFASYKRERGREWADEDLKAIMGVLTRKSFTSGGRAGGNVAGYLQLRRAVSLHTSQEGDSFQTDIIRHLREGGIIIVDLSQGDPTIQNTYSEKICAAIFRDSMSRFIEMRANNFIQFYFEEAHNLFPKKDDKDLSQIYNRIAKEGAKLSLGMTYATQEVSSISANILKNTQNWFIAHLNNDDELKEIKKFYDFEDFCDGLLNYSAGTDKGFIKMKTYSNAFVVPVQVDKFEAK